MHMQDYEIPETKKRNIWILVLGLAAVVVLVFLVYYATKINKPATSESHEINFSGERVDYAYYCRRTGLPKSD